MRDHPLVWAELNWEELPDDLDSVGRAAILPVGATKQRDSRRWPGTIALDPLPMTQLVAHIGNPASRPGVAEQPPLPHGYYAQIDTTAASETIP